MAPPTERGGEVQVHNEGSLYKVLATRIRKPLRRELKLHCETMGTSMMDFATKAIEEKLTRSSRAQAKRRETKA
jgi:hypothetical protein